MFNQMFATKIIKLIIKKQFLILNQNKYLTCKNTTENHKNTPDI